MPGDLVYLFISLGTAQCYTWHRAPDLSVMAAALISGLHDAATWPYNLLVSSMVDGLEVEAEGLED